MWSGHPSRTSELHLLEGELELWVVKKQELECLSSDGSNDNEPLLSSSACQPLVWCINSCNIRASHKTGCEGCMAQSPRMFSRSIGEQRQLNPQAKHAPPPSPALTSVSPVFPTPESLPLTVCLCILLPHASCLCMHCSFFLECSSLARTSSSYQDQYWL